MYKQYENRANIHSCAFDASDLVQLGNIITEDITNLRRPVKVKIDFPDGSTELSDYSEFPQHDELLRTMHSVLFFAVSADDDERNNHIQSVFLLMDKASITLIVKSNNENWARGNFERIKDFLHTKRSKLWYRVTRLMYFPTYLLSALLAAFSILLAEMRNAYFWLSGAFFSALCLWLFLGFKGFFTGATLPYTAFVTSTGTSDIISRVDKIKILLALIAAVVAIVALLLTVFIPLPIKHP